MPKIFTPSPFPTDDSYFLVLAANEDIENFQTSVSLIFQFSESKFLSRAVVEHIGEVIFI